MRESSVKVYNQVPMNNINNQFPTQEFTRPGFLISTDASFLDHSMIHAYLANESYWARGVSFEVVQTSLRYSLCFGVYTVAGNGRHRQIGLARVISDFATFAYLADVFILSDFQGQGLGKWLVQCILAHPAFTTLRKFTLDTDDAHSLYAQFGFKVNPTPDKHMIYRPHEVAE